MANEILLVGVFKIDNCISPCPKVPKSPIFHMNVYVHMSNSKRETIWIQIKLTFSLIESVNFEKEEIIYIYIYIYIHGDYACLIMHYFCATSDFQTRLID